MTNYASILLAEDDESDVLLLQRAFKDAGISHGMHVANDGQEAIDFLTARGASDRDRLPALVLLDLKMPRRTGMDVLQWIRGQPGVRCLPVVVFSSSAHREDIERAHTLGASAFIVKPSSMVERAEIARFLSDWLRFNQSPLATTEGLRAAKAFSVTRGLENLRGG
jgi:CheY-like chemotaxis protein